MLLRIKAHHVQRLMWSDTPASGFVLREDSQTILRCWEPCEMEFFWEAEVGRAGAGKKKHRRE